MSAKGRPERPPGAPNSSSYQGFLRDLMLGPRMLRRAMNLWPPFVGAGIKVTQISADYRDVEVRLALGLLNRNYVGTQFGGSLFAMTDPFYMLMLLRNLGPEYVVWDKAGRIEYLRPGRGTVKARFHLDEADVVKARRATTRGRRYLPRFAVDVVDRDGDVIARVEKTLYVRRKRADDVAPAATATKRPSRRTSR